MFDSILKRHQQSEPESQGVAPQKIDNQRYWEVQAKNGRIVVDVERARKAMRYAMKRHAEARRKEKLENVEEN